MAAKAKKIRTPEQEASRLARRFLPSQAARNGRFEAVDVSNHSEGDQRHMIRSNERRTIRRKPKFDELRDAKVISPIDAKACEWYFNTHSAAYDTRVKTANPEAIGGGGGSPCHAAKTPSQVQAKIDYDRARAGIDPRLVVMFENVVLRGRPLGKLKLSFRLAARQLREGMPHLFEVG